MMLAIAHQHRRIALEIYEKNGSFFPLIASVLNSAQGGEVYVNRNDEPSQFYVEHAFGFAQIYGHPHAGFEQTLKNYLLKDKNIGGAKVRLYGIYVPRFLLGEHQRVALSYRQRFTLGAGYLTTQAVLPTGQRSRDVQIVLADKSNIDTIQEKFGVVCRFWRTAEDFIENAHAVVILFKGAAAAICYSAATVGQRAEIDVLTLPEYRNLGLGRLVVARFIESTRLKKIEPLWDCFTNNTSSMRLANSVGFRRVDKPYPFFTINR
jgi:hypothetical protein